jgi:hypothetical protein
MALDGRREQDELDLSKFKVLALQPQTLGHALSTATMPTPPPIASKYVLTSDGHTVECAGSLSTRANGMYDLVEPLWPDYLSVDPGHANIFA